MAKSHINALDSTEVDAFLASLGSSLRGPYVNSYEPFLVACADCPTVFSRSLKHIKFRKLDKLRCVPCHRLHDSKQKQLGSDAIAAELLAIGSELLAPLADTLADPLHFRCSKCHNSAQYSTLRNLRLNNPQAWCTCCQQEANWGANHPWYKPEITREYREIKRMLPEYRAWMDAVYTRDDHTCLVTGVRGGKLAAHHLYSFARWNGKLGRLDLRLVLDNGVTLARDVHERFHAIYGKRENTAEQFAAFYLAETGRVFHTPQALRLLE